MVEISGRQEATVVQVLWQHRCYGRCDGGHYGSGPGVKVAMVVMDSKKFIMDLTMKFNDSSGGNSN